MYKRQLQISIGMSIKFQNEVKRKAMKELRVLEMCIRDRVTPVYCYTDGVEGELFVNGKSQGRVRKDKSCLLYTSRCV